MRLRASPSRYSMTPGCSDASASRSATERLRVSSVSAWHLNGAVHSAQHSAGPRQLVADPGVAGLETGRALEERHGSLEERNRRAGGAIRLMPASQFAQHPCLVHEILGVSRHGAIERLEDAQGLLEVHRCVLGVAELVEDLGVAQVRAAELGPCRRGVEPRHEVSFIGLLAQLEQVPAQGLHAGGPDLGVDQDVVVEPVDRLVVELEVLLGEGEGLRTSRLRARWSSTVARARLAAATRTVAAAAATRVWCRPSQRRARTSHGSRQAETGSSASHRSMSDLSAAAVS